MYRYCNDAVTIPALFNPSLNHDPGVDVISAQLGICPSRGLAVESSVVILHLRDGEEAEDGAISKVRLPEGPVADPTTGARGTRGRAHGLIRLIKWMLDDSAKVRPSGLDLGEPIGGGGLGTKVGGEYANLGLGSDVVLIHVVNLVLVGVLANDEHAMSRDVGDIVRFREIKALVADLGSNGGGEAGGDSHRGTAELSIHTGDIPSGRKVEGIDASTRVVG
jgi:hypothetical protein